MATTIWRVTTDDAAWPSERRTYLLSGRSAAIVATKALKLHKALDRDLLPRERRHRPYIRSIELIGDLDD